MTRKEFLEYCFDTYGTSADYPFEDDLETAVLRHENNRKWYALVMNVLRRKFGILLPKLMLRIMIVPECGKLPKG